MPGKSRNVAALDEVQASCGQILRENAFRKRGRSFNRPHQDGLVGVVAFVAMPSWSCRHGSFGVELGVVLPCLERIEYPELARSKDWYQPQDCALRTWLPALAGLPSDYLWDSSQPPLEMVAEIHGLLRSVGCPFLDEFTSYAAVVAHYSKHGVLPGVNPHRSALEAAMIHHHLGNEGAARECFGRALDTEHKRFREHVEEIRNRCLAEGA